MAELRKYNTPALFYFPLIEDGDADFVTDYTPAAGDAKIFTDLLVSTNPTALILGFDSLSEIPAQGAQIDEQGAGTAEGIVEFTVIVSGTVGGGTAAGFFFMRSVAGEAWTNNDVIDINGGNTSIADADSTTYDLAATAGLIASLGNGMFAAALSSTEMACAQGQIHIVDSATKAIEDQAIQFHTYGNASALHGLDLDVADGSNFTEAGGTGDQFSAIPEVALVTLVTTTTTLTNKTGFALSTAGILAIWDQVTSVLTTAGRIGKLLVDNINATISSAATAVGFATSTKQDTMETTLNAAATATAVADVPTVAEFNDRTILAASYATAAALAIVGGNVDDIETDTAEIGTAVGADISADIAALFTTQMTESYNVDGTAPTPAQALMMIMQALTEFSISGTTITVKKLDGSATAYTGTLSDGTNPTSLTRAT